MGMIDGIVHQCIEGKAVAVRLRHWEEEGLTAFRVLEIMDVIIPELIHWIPSDLHSYAFLGECSIRMVDPLGCPHVVSLIFVRFVFSIIFIYSQKQHLGQNIVRTSDRGT